MPFNHFGQNPDSNDDFDPSTIEFLTFEDVCAIHDRGLAEFNEGEPGFLSEHSVRSAAAQPEAGMFGAYFHEFPAGMAAAYLFYLANQQGFRNGNKRSAVGSAIEFLARNGYRLNATNWDVYVMTKEVAGEEVQGDTKEKLRKLTKWIERRLQPMP
jgi:prophage maintenance system killer protein